MITGFNTDIVFQGVTYHVQTEDKGVKTPLILSLVYDRGTILASKRSPYDDLLKGEFSEEVLAERLSKQHKLICAAVRAGRIEDLRQMTLKESARQKEAKNAPVEKISSPAKIKSPVANQVLTEMPNAVIDVQIPKPILPPTIALDNIKKVNVSGEEVWEIPINVLEDLIVDEKVAEDEITLISPDAVAVVPPVIDNPAEEKQLTVELLNEVVLKSGERKTLSILVKRGAEALAAVHVMVKVLGSSFRPLISHAKTDSNGVAIVPVHLPKFSRGRAAVLVRAMSGGEEVELRRTITQD